MFLLKFFAQNSVLNFFVCQTVLVLFVFVTLIVLAFFLRFTHVRGVVWQTNGSAATMAYSCVFVTELI